MQLLLLHILIIQPVWNAFNLNCSDPHPILCSLLCLHAKLHCKSVPSLPPPHPILLQTQQRKRHYWRLDCKCIILFQNNTSNKYYKVHIVYSMIMHDLNASSYLFFSSYITGASSCRRSLCPRSWRCVLPETSPSSPQAQILTASSSLLALCATLLGRTPILSPLCPQATPRLSPQPRPPLAK